MPKRLLEGKVVSNKCNKTVTVLVERKIQDALYGKIMRRSAKYAAHDEQNQWVVGDLVTIEECRPISKTKTWKVIGGKAMGESQARTVDDADQKRVSVKRSQDAQAAAAATKAAAKAPAAKVTETKAAKPAAKKTKKDE
jgi:small subunit ribosomal protein S17